MRRYELGGLVWEDVEGQEIFPVSAWFELTTKGITTQPPHTLQLEETYLDFLHSFFFW